MNSNEAMRLNAQKMHKYISMKDSPRRKYCNFNEKEDVCEFQRENGLRVTGELDLATFERLVDLYEGMKIECGNFAAIPMGKKCDFIKNRYNIMNLQIIINEISELFSNLIPLELTGEYDKQTKAAVMELQEIFGLPSNGIVSKPFWNILTKTKGALLDFVE